MKFYIATGINNAYTHNIVRDLLIKEGHEITYDWTLHGAVISKGLERCKEVCLLEIEGVYTADVVIVIWPGGRGAHVELGIAIASKKQIHLVSCDPQILVPSPESSIFYFHPRIELHSSIETILDLYKRKN